MGGLGFGSVGLLPFLMSVDIFSGCLFRMRGGDTLAGSDIIVVERKSRGMKLDRGIESCLFGS